MSPSEINPERNERHRAFRQFNRETILIILVSVALIAAAISWFRAESAIDAANKASAIATTWQQMYKETERECRLAQLEIDDFNMALVKAGIEVEHNGESP